MIKKLTIYCEDVAITKAHTTNDMELELTNIHESFINSLEVEDVVRGFDVPLLLEAIGVEDVAEWLREKGI